MHWLDAVVLVVLVVSTLLGLKRGLIGTALPLIGLIVGVVLAGRYYGPVGESLLSAIDDPNLNKIASYALIVVVALIASLIVAFFLRRVVGMMLLGWVDHLAGAILGLVIGAAVWGAILAALLQFPFWDIESTVEGSTLARALTKYFPLLLSLLPGEFDAVREFFQ